MLVYKPKSMDIPIPFIFVLHSNSRRLFAFAPVPRAQARDQHDQIHCNRRLKMNSPQSHTPGKRCNIAASDELSIKYEKEKKQCERYGASEPKTSGLIFPRSYLLNQQWWHHVG
jgi:hypothetical protein